MKLSMWFPSGNSIELKRIMSLVRVGNRKLIIKERKGMFEIVEHTETYKNKADRENAIEHFMHYLNFRPDLFE